MFYSLQKASIWKRLSAFVLDIIFTCIIAVAFALLISWVTGYNNVSDQYVGYIASYEEQYGVKFGITSEEYEALTETEKENYKAATTAWSNDMEARRVYSLTISLTLLITSLGIFFAILVMEFILPLVFKHGQTLGKKVFGICVMQTNGVKMSTIALFVRTFLGKYVVETMVPVLLVMMTFFNVLDMLTCIIVLALLLILEIVLICATKTNSPIHDIFSGTVVVDEVSQRIFDTYEEMVEFTAQQHKEAVTDSKY